MFAPSSVRERPRGETLVMKSRVHPKYKTKFRVANWPSYDRALTRRGQQLDVKLRCIPVGEAVHLVVDSSGLSIVGEGEWAAAKHGGNGKRG